MNEIKIFLTPIDAEKYKMFLQHYDFFNLLIEQEAHSFKSGSIELHYNPQGVMTSITKHKMTYRK